MSLNAALSNYVKVGLTYIYYYASAPVGKEAL